jgi:FkbM family methyltransferase
MSNQSNSVVKGLAFSIIGKATDILRNTPLRKSAFLIKFQENLLLLFYKKETVKVGEFDVKIHSPTEIIGKKLVLEGGFETEEIAFLCSLAQPGDTVVDVGANIGLYTLHMSRAVSPTGKVFAFEPDPENLAILRENIKINHCDNVTVVPVALGASSSRMTLFTCDENKGFQSFANLVDSKKSIEVEVQRADDILKDHSLSVMKIDVEGAEPMVWQGMGTNKPQNLLFEFVPWQQRAVGNDPLQFLRALVSEGYTLFQLDGANLISVTPEEMTARAEKTGIDYNLFAKRALIPNKV